MHHIIADVEISRRKSLNHVLSDHNEMLFSDKSLRKCIAWIVDQGETEALLHSEPADILITLELMPF